jgi:uncharacterized damage-inducible protein DinB
MASSTEVPSARKSARKSPGKRSPPVDLGRALVAAFQTNERINQTLLDLIRPSIWATLPRCSHRRTIATSFAHIHNVRCMRLKASRYGLAIPARLDRATVTQAQAREALGQSAAAMVQLIERSLAAGGHVADFRPDVVALVCDAITHDAHHRGQVCHYARQLRSPIGPDCQVLLWDWHARSQEVKPGAAGRAGTGRPETNSSAPGRRRIAAGKANAGSTPTGRRGLDKRNGSREPPR